MYKGSWKNDKREGFGIKVDAEGRYEGEWKNDQKEGKGNFIFRNGDKFQGFWH